MSWQQLSTKRKARDARTVAEQALITEIHSAEAEMELFRERVYGVLNSNPKQEITFRWDEGANSSDLHVLYDCKAGNKIDEWYRHAPYLSYLVDDVLETLGVEEIWLGLDAPDGEIIVKFLPPLAEAAITVARCAAGKEGWL